MHHKYYFKTWLTCFICLFIWGGRLMITSTSHLIVQRTASRTWMQIVSTIKKIFSRRPWYQKTWLKNSLVVFLLVIVLLQGMKWTIFVKRSTTTKMESNETKNGRSMMKSMEMEVWAPTKIAHVADGEDSLRVHKHHMIQRTLSHTSTFLTIVMKH